MLRSFTKIHFIRDEILAVRKTHHCITALLNVFTMETFAWKRKVPIVHTDVFIDICSGFRNIAPTNISRAYNMLGLSSAVKYLVTTSSAYNSDQKTISSSISSVCQVVLRSGRWLSVSENTEKVTHYLRSDSLLVVSARERNLKIRISD